MLSSRNILIYLAIISKGDWQQIYDYASSHYDFDPNEAIKVIDSLKCKTITILDADYPIFLKSIYHPPFVLFYYGDISYIYNLDKNLGVVGSRECSEYGVNATKAILTPLVHDYIFVSGMAKGIDSIAHQIAIENKGKTIAVLGSGIDYCYPIYNKEIYDEIKKHHLLISEYPGNLEPDQSHFPSRNRIVSALSKCLLITESKQHSGTSITASFSLSLGRSILCVPAPFDVESGCNELIKQGASLVVNSDDVKYEM